MFYMCSRKDNSGQLRLIMKLNIFHWQIITHVITSSSSTLHDSKCDDGNCDEHWYDDNDDDDVSWNGTYKDISCFVFFYLL